MQQSTQHSQGANGAGQLGSREGLVTGSLVGQQMVFLMPQPQPVELPLGSALHELQGMQVTPSGG